MKQIRRLKLKEKWLLGSMAVMLAIVSFLVLSSRKVAVLDSEVMAAVTNPSPGSPGYMMVNLPIPGSWTANQTNIVRFKMPWPATLLGFSAIVRNTGSTGAMTVDMTEAGSSVLGAAIAVHEHQVTEATISDSVIADEALVGVTFAITAGTWSDPTVQMIFKRK